MIHCAKKPRFRAKSAAQFHARPAHWDARHRAAPCPQPPSPRPEKTDKAESDGFWRDPYKPY